MSQIIITFAAMKLQKYILIEILMMALATFGLIWLTGSYLMSLGIVILLVIVEHVLVSYMEKKQEEKEDIEDATTDQSL
jgi:Flp pilus assembly protein TadB